MANEKNLIPGCHKLTLEEQSRAGKASGEARRARKTFREELLFLLSQDNNNEKISIALMQKALDGDVKAFQALRDTIGEMPVTKQEVDLTDKVININLTDGADDKS